MPKLKGLNATIRRKPKRATKSCHMSNETDRCQCHSSQAEGMSGKILSINISDTKGTIKHRVSTAIINQLGIIGDAHAGNWHRQISLLDIASIIKFQKQFHRNINYGEFAENLTIQGIDLSCAAVGDRFRSGKMELEVTQIGKQCRGHKCDIFKITCDCIMPKKGIFCRVIRSGEITSGDVIEYFPKIWKILVITLSDRASNNEYEDKSGPIAQDILSNFFIAKKWRYQIKSIILPDEAMQLKEHLQKARIAKTDLIVTLGSTGIGPRDIAPEVIISICDKIIPGIMENIRRKFSTSNINATLSRSVAGIVNKTQVYALPGNPRAVAEYLPEILKTLEHIILMLNGLDPH